MGPNAREREGRGKLARQENLGDIGIPLFGTLGRLKGNPKGGSQRRLPQKGKRKAGNRLQPEAERKSGHVGESEKCEIIGIDPKSIAKDACERSTTGQKSGGLGVRSLRGG